MAISTSRQVRPPMPMTAKRRQWRAGGVRSQPANWECVWTMRTVLWSLVACVSAVVSLACNSRTPAEPTRGPQKLPMVQQAALPFTVAGKVTEYRGGPLADVMVQALPNFPPGNGVKTTLTDNNGVYRIGGLSEEVLIHAEKEGYESTGFGAFIGDQILNLTLNRTLSVSAGQPFTGVIWGDSALAGEDWSGANCDSEDKPCQLIRVATSRAGTLTAQLQWNGQKYHLGVFISAGLFVGQGAYGSSPVEASLDVPTGEHFVIVSFKKANGGRPSQSATQAYELLTALK
jgi:hypothetical protein